MAFKLKKIHLISIVLCFLAVLIGSFLAFCFVFEKLAKDYNVVTLGKLNISQFMVSPENAFDEFDKQFEKRIEEINKQNQFFSNMREFKSFDDLEENTSFVKLKENSKNYVIELSLKPFNNNEKNVEIKTKNNRLIITAKYKEKNEKSLNSASFYQSLNLPKNIKESQIKKTVENGDLIIRIEK
jgi:HSP20 family molecular chaperone IbpA